MTSSVVLSLRTCLTLPMLPFSRVGPAMKQIDSPGKKTSKPTACACMYLQRISVGEISSSMLRHVEWTLMASSIMFSKRAFSTWILPLVLEKWVASPEIV